MKWNSIAQKTEDAVRTAESPWEFHFFDGYLISSHAQRDCAISHNPPAAHIVPPVTRARLIILFISF